ncbi:unnamed protein product [Rotaria magnacalcarata]|uniref:G-protein coupled receptors family 1 profile domain-containing protein n=1 Tax=Rotaria magnacalcarata TaxID=392030 RepID=A0A816N618_9BILA|nr:unnamed protein product [Rotaria magnacalcarata]CAF1633923.1 unnamed protein product [Rotaria magnacalcarata]CAF2030779.1 unnamed protein product [Rotaria magnacalcarata]CAF2066081.1 unnamed protein product [Rotaria magnacalcarata]CAF2082250.1 unnamed protein product [Rotaria magnacalcarata]
MNSTTILTNTSDFMSDNRYVQIAARSEEFILPCLLLIGTTCNTLTFIVMRRGRMRHSSSCFYMAALAITDTFVLWIGCLNRWLELLGKQRPILACNMCCKLGTFGFFFFADCSVWITVAMTFERYIAVSQPLRASQVCTIKRARYMLLLVFTVFFLINSHFLWTFHLSSALAHCVPLNDQSLFIRYFTWIDSFKYSFCPFTLLITLNILIIKSLLNARNTNKYLQQETTSDSHANYNTKSNSMSFSSTSTTNTSIKKSKNKLNCNPLRSLHLYQQEKHTSTKALAYRRVNRRLTTMLLAVSFAFCICSMPISIMQLIDAIYSDINHRSTTLTAGIAIGKIIAEISQYLNHSSNFFLYAFTGRVFRHELRRLFSCHYFLLFSSSSTSMSSSQRLSKRAKKLMLLHSPSQGLHEHFYSNGKRYTRVIVAPRPSINLSQTCTYRQSICSAYSLSEIPLTNQNQRLHQNSIVFNDEQDDNFLTCYRHQTVEPRISSATQGTSIMLLDSPTASVKHNSALVSCVESMKNQQTTPLLRSNLEKTAFAKTIKPYGLTDIITPNL